MGEAIKTKVRVGKITYMNCLPFYHNLDTDEAGVEYFESVPSKINKAIRSGAIDIAPISSLEYLDHQEEYLILPDYVIAARRFVGSVLLFSRRSFDRLNGAKIALSKESLSSIVLLKILLEFKNKSKNNFQYSDSNLSEMLSSNDAALLIGDQALLAEPGQFLYKHDLAEEWFSWTEKPFCFALWAVRKEFAENHPEAVSDFCQMLRRNTQKNLTNIHSLIETALELNFLDEGFSKIFGYLFNLQYEMNDEILESLELYYRFAKKLGVSPKFRAFNFFKI